jgi:hypothetical protein
MEPSTHLPPRREPGIRPRASAWRRGLLGGGIALYLALLLAGHALGQDWLDELAVLVLASLFLLAALARGSAAAWMAWIALAAVLAWLGVAGLGRLAVDAVPVGVTAAIAALFARTLRPGVEPLIACAIRVIDGPGRLQQPGLRAYARGLTLAWALLLGAHALLLAALLWLAPGGLADAFGWPGAGRLSSPGWRHWLHFGSLAVVPAFLLVEYGYRRWRLRHVEHLPLPLFLARLVRRWPALVHGMAGERERGAP